MINPVFNTQNASPQLALDFTTVALDLNALGGGPGAVMLVGLAWFSWRQMDDPSPSDA